MVKEKTLTYDERETTLKKAIEKVTELVKND
jgi:hypothetical protein